MLNLLLILPAFFEEIVLDEEQKTEHILPDETPKKSVELNKMTVLKRIFAIRINVLD